MDPKLIATLQLVVAFGAEVNDWIRHDSYGEWTRVSITWPDQSSMTLYTEPFDGSGEAAMAIKILEDLTHVLRSQEPE